MAGSANGLHCQPELNDLIPLPEGSELFTLPDRKPVGTDPGSGEPLLLEKSPEGKDIRAVAAFMAPAHTAVSLLPTRQRQTRSCCRCSPTRPSAGMTDVSGSLDFAATMTDGRIISSSNNPLSTKKPAGNCPDIKTTGSFSILENVVLPTTARQPEITSWDAGRLRCRHLRHVMPAAWVVSHSSRPAAVPRHRSEYLLFPRLRKSRRSAYLT